MAGLPVSPEKFLRDIALTEGQAQQLYGYYVGAIAAGPVSTGLLPGFMPNRAVIIDAVVLSSNYPMYIDVPISGNSLTVALPANGTAVIPLGGALYRPWEGITAIATIKRLRNADGTPAATGVSDAVVTAGLVSRSIYDDINVHADKVIYFKGDSVFCGLGRSTKLEMYDWKLRNYYASKQSVRGAMHAVSGKTSADYRGWLNNGAFDGVRKIDLLVYELMINNAAQKPGGEGSYVANYVADLQAEIAWKQARHPGAKMLVLGCYPQQVAATEAAAVLLRAAAAAAVSAVNDPLIKFCDLGQLGAEFSSVNANYPAIDGVGTGVHLSPQGDSYVWLGNNSWPGGLRGWLDANMPAI